MEVHEVLEKYPPLKIETEKIQDRGGTRERIVFIAADGARIKPNVPVGPEMHHAELFTWYERAFGRGKAGYLTHFPAVNPVVRERIGAQFGEDYRKIAPRAGRVMVNGTPEQTQEMIAIIKDFVLKYPNLYKE